MSHYRKEDFLKPGRLNNDIAAIVSAEILTPPIIDLMNEIKFDRLPNDHQGFFVTKIPKKSGITSIAISPKTNASHTNKFVQVNNSSLVSQAEEDAE